MSTGLTTEQPPASSGSPLSTEVTSTGLHGGSPAAVSSRLPKTTTASSQQVTATLPTPGTTSTPRRSSRQLWDGYRHPARPITARIAHPVPGTVRPTGLARGMV
ncbi:hypothetical protein V5799_009658 [Amblyomma americanum]|uniref:Uncharacterized protein n=1 Tax=Amblyomma americanum TaxID=6943 RepID=A0AAQ4F9R9_AMBAM